MSATGAVGREELLARAWKQLRDDHSVVVTGPAGAGKSTVLDALARRAADAGDRVLRCAPVEAETGLPFLALIDLLAGLDGDPAWAQLTPSWQASLAAVRHGAVPPGDQAQQLVIRLAARQLCRVVARRRPLLLVIDDLQWLDPASEQVLAFIARRVGDAPVRALVSQRSASAAAAGTVAAAPLTADPDRPDGALASPHAPPVCPPPVHQLSLPPLSLAVLRELLIDQLGVVPPPATLRRIHATSAGNPLFALELVRALARLPQPPAPEEPLPVPDRLRGLMRERLTAVPAATQQTLLLVAAAARPTGALLRLAGRRHASAHLATAAELGIVEVSHGGVVRFTHPLLAATVYGDAPPTRRKQAHAQLAAAVTDPIERARHRARAAHGPDEAVARSLIRAAQVARRRGAPAVAAELAQAAADRTPQPARAGDRILRAAADALAAGLCDQARHLAESVLANATAPRQRVAAWLVVLDATSQALPHAEPLLAQALADAGDRPRLQAQIRVRAVTKALMEGELPRALAEADRCAQLAETAQDQDTLLRVLCMRAVAELSMGRAEVAATIGRAQQLAGELPHPPTYHGPRHLLARSYLHQDRFEEARAELTPLIAQAEAAGQVEDLAALLRNLAEVELRAGRCRPALAAAHRSLQLVEDADLSTGPVLSVAALAEAVGGDPDRARALAERGVALASADGDQFSLSRNLHALGLATLMTGETSTAVAALRRVAQIEARMGELDPTLFRWHADHVEALVADQELTEAAAALATFRPPASRLRRRSVLAALARAEAWSLLAQGDAAHAAGQLRLAAAELTGMPLEYGRTLYALGVAERRRRRRTAARTAFRDALAIFEQAGAAPWAQRTRAELAAPEPTGGGELTTIEHRIAELVTAGATNQQVASALSVSVKTVEAHLTRIYRKRGVRSRAELAGAFATEQRIKGFS
ncbi:AAA family ATPase [Natronosporangium hydrolyticum]|uniref:AAA family ATPase n=1 Tax=Natronosporangium hydrolyticum TaxID=2811111 RepID=A0A895YG55_9ACTN|nr:LuxR family transcriptional regulator [Natronosporangium hydrolyticum]QSB12658.1 AAA family ATPase [Natronosporangium hydrolyticum]